MVKKVDVKLFLAKNIVPIIFIALGAIAAPLSKFGGVYLVQEIVTRLGRDMFLVLALLIPLIAGMGINFGLALGAYSAQVAMILVLNWGIGGVGGMFLSMLVATPIAIFVGLFAGYLLNRAKGREMITTYIMGFFILGVYQVIVMYILGKFLPITNQEILLSRGYGIRATVLLNGMGGSFDNLIDNLLHVSITVGGVHIPLFSVLLVTGLCLLTWWFRKTKMGQEIRAIGQDMDVSSAAGIKVDRTRILSMIISTVLAAYGQLIFIQNIGVMNVYGGAQATALYAAAALLVGGASATKAGIPRVILGTALFHFVFIVMPMAANKSLGMPAVAEYVRLIVSYSAVAAALIINAWNAKKERDQALFGHRKRSGGTGG
jgi:simple sugar transport system permease protein